MYTHTACTQPNNYLQSYCLKLAHVHVHACGKHALQKHHHDNKPGHTAICNLMALGNMPCTHTVVVYTTSTLLLLYLSLPPYLPLTLPTHSHTFSLTLSLSLPLCYFPLTLPTHTYSLSLSLPLSLSLSLSLPLSLSLSCTFNLLSLILPIHSIFYSTL